MLRVAAFDSCDPMNGHQRVNRGPPGRSDAARALLASALALAACGGNMIADGGVPDGGDAGLSDGGVPDGGDAGSSDGGMPDGGLADSGMTDAGWMDAGCLSMTPAQHLSMGLCPPHGQMDYCFFGGVPPNF